MVKKVRLKEKGSNVCFTVNVKHTNKFKGKTFTGTKEVIFGIPAKLPQLKRNERAYRIPTTFTKC
ncbi:MAG TPA: hypothetical protein VMZ91_11925 [Candidatus Paceibacterota bacterium]|nr:hypothetical protein [Candidatus Paceibacterota bacterium]